MVWFKSEFSPSYKLDILDFHLQNIDPRFVFQSPESQAGLLLLKQIRKPRDEFVEVWKGILEILGQ